jgi:ketosteroid isomerase-like protein
MNKAVFVLPLFLGAGLAFAAAAVDLQASFDSLVAAEKAFSRTSLEKGVGEAFDRYLMTDAVLLRPTPEHGAKWVNAVRPTFGVADITWEPREAVLSRSGDFAWVTGPWEIRPKGNPVPVQRGEFLSIWRKGADGAWKVAMDTAVAGPEPDQPAVAPSALKIPAQAGGDPASVCETILEIDRKVSAAALGDANGYLPYLSEDARFLRMFGKPVTGKAAIRSVMEKSWTPLNWAQFRCDASSAGDMVYTY